jgi:hypothetical protein
MTAAGHRELVSGSNEEQRRSRAVHGGAGAALPWMLKQVQHDGGGAAAPPAPGSTGASKLAQIGTVIFRRLSPLATPA